MSSFISPSTSEEHDTFLFSFLLQLPIDSIEGCTGDLLNISFQSQLVDIREYGEQVEF